MVPSPSAQPWLATAIRCSSGRRTLNGAGVDPPLVALLMGEGGLRQPFGDGLHCIIPGSSGLYVLRELATSDGTNVNFGPGLVTFTHDALPPAGHIQPGDKWAFQAVYFDGVSPCRTGLNTSNAITVDFAP